MNRVALSVVVTFAGLSGCAAPAHYIQKGPDAGVVAIPENSDDWPTHYRPAALALIEKHVGPNYVITHEEQVNTGTSTASNQRVNDPQNPYAPGSVTSTSTTQATHEWRITYQKRAVPMGAPIGGPVGNSGFPSPGAGLGAGTRPVGGMVPSVGPAGAGGPSAGVVPSVGPAGGYPTGSYPGAPTTGGYPAGGGYRGN